MDIDKIVIRYDYLQNEQLLAQQLNAAPCIIVSDCPINLDLLAQFKPRIVTFFYEVKENHNPSFIEKVQKLGIPIA